MMDWKKLTPKRHEYCIEDRARMVEQIWRWKLIKLNNSWRKRETHMQSLCSRRSGEEAMLSSWHRGGTLSHCEKKFQGLEFTKFQIGFLQQDLWMDVPGFLAWQIFINHWMWGFGREYIRAAVGQNVLPYVSLVVSLARQLRKWFCKRCCFHFSFLLHQTFFTATGVSMRPIYSLWNHISPGVEKLARLHCQY